MASMIIAIGAQNVFVLKQGLLKQAVFTVAFICFLCDFLLTSAGVLGIGEIFSISPNAAKILSLCGVIFLSYYGFCALLRAIKPTSLTITQGKKSSYWKIVAQTLAVTLLNPHVYLDTMVIVGTVGAKLAATQRWTFLFGCISASFLWFFCLAYGARLLLPLFNRPITWRILDGAIAIIMWAIALSLLLSVIK
ncbi:MAG: amino acid transporter [Neisseriaceae bacterium]|nr:amino acid transporter [Neisseriaceae bacterium]